MSIIEDISEKSLSLSLLCVCVCDNRRKNLVIQAANGNSSLFYGRRFKFFSSFLRNVFKYVTRFEDARFLVKKETSKKKEKGRGKDG